VPSNEPVICPGNRSHWLGWNGQWPGGHASALWAAIAGELITGEALVVQLRFDAALGCSAEPRP